MTSERLVYFLGQTCFRFVCVRVCVCLVSVRSLSNIASAAAVEIMRSESGLVVVVVAQVCCS